MTHDEIIAVIAAHRDGKLLQILRDQEWQQESFKTAELLHNLAFGLKIRPKPEPRRVYVLWDAAGCTGEAYSQREFAEKYACSDWEIVTFVEQPK